MKIKYEFANEVIEIEVSDEWGMVILEMDRLDYNNDKKETRRHLSLDTGFDQGSWLMSDEHDPEQGRAADDVRYMDLEPDTSLTRQ